MTLLKGDQPDVASVLFSLPADRLRIAVIGLGYVGFPLAVAFGKYFSTLGFDTDAGRICELSADRDRTGEVLPDEIHSAKRLRLTNSSADLAGCNVFVVTVPTPIDGHNRPDLSQLLGASETVGGAIPIGGMVIYESTVYPGATEEECVPVIERVSGLRFNQDFFVGYSPERANPGDRDHRLSSIRKVTAGSTPAAAAFTDKLYARIVAAGTHPAPSIKVAEAAKVIENTQRDLNIALVNEFALIFNRLGIDTNDVIDAAATKWNFLPFRPGLVGGHCVGVDPYYLTHKAEAVGYRPEVILSGRRINDGMGVYVASQLVKAMLRKRIQVHGARVLVMGLTFKEDCSDVRNTRVVDIVAELNEYNASVDVYDPWADAADAEREYGVKLIDEPEMRAYDAIVLAVAHKAFRESGSAKIASYGRDPHVFYDLKSVFPRAASDLRL